jgi:hypothetical protein
MMHLQASPGMTAPPCSQSSYFDSPATWLDAATPSPPEKDKPMRPPPGLWLSENVPAAPVKKAGAMQLSLADMFATVEQQIIQPPPGLELSLNVTTSKLEAIEPPPGLSLPEKGAESDTSVGSLSSAGQQLSENDDSGPSDGEEKPGLKLVLALATRNTLKANSPMFCPVLSPGTASLLMPDVAQRTPLRTKLRSKADVYVPGAGPLPFMPMAAVNESWQKWHTQNSMYEYYAEPDGSYDASAEYYEEQDCTSSYENAADFYPEQEWPYEM